MVNTAHYTLSRFLTDSSAASLVFELLSDFSELIVLLELSALLELSVLLELSESLELFDVSFRNASRIFCVKSFGSPKHSFDPEIINGFRVIFVLVSITTFQIL